jgi:hypothetical protein
MHLSHWPKVDARWYLGVRCRKCRAPILFGIDHSERDAQPAAPGKLFLTCPLTECRHQADYSKAVVSRFQKEPSGMKEPAGRT